MTHASPGLTLAQQAQLVRALANRTVLGHAVTQPKVLETHISYVLLTGDYAYKIKKAVNLGFLDFADAQVRRFFCEEELRLNRRSAPELYLAVLSIAGSAEHPRLLIDESGEDAIEHALKMREFPQEALADNLLRRDELTPHDIDQLAAHLADYHLRAEPAAPATEYGTPREVEQPMLQNFQQIAALGGDSQELTELAHWTEQQLALLALSLTLRKQQGFVREGHGDLHLGNVVRYKGQLLAFDCLEFDPALRWIDVMNDIAFLLMDFDYGERRDLDARFLNRYLEITGDYGGVGLLPLYQAYRALVRAKVALIKAKQRAAQSAAMVLPDFTAHLELARRYTHAPRAALLLTHGFSGSGKTTLSQSLLELIGAIRIRSDLERKRSHGLSPLAHSHSNVAAGLYTESVNEDTYQRLYDLATSLVRAGRVVIVDATFLQRAKRDLFRALARSLRVPFAILHFSAPVAELQRRVADRARAAMDASEADIDVLAHQLKSHDPLAPEERDDTVEISSAKRGGGDGVRAATRWQPLLDRLYAQWPAASA